MPTFTIEQVYKVRGTQELTQGLPRIENMILSDIDSMGGKKILGISKTRKHVRTREFDMDALRELADICVNCKGDVSNEFVKKHSRKLLSRLFRDFVAIDMVEEFIKAGYQRFALNDGDAKKTIEEIAHYLSCGDVVPVAETYRHARKELAEGKVIYLEPRKTIATIKAI